MPFLHPKQPLPYGINLMVAEDIHKRNNGDERKHSNDEAAQDGRPNPVHVKAHLQAREPYSQTDSDWGICMSFAEHFTLCCVA